MAADLPADLLPGIVTADTLDQVDPEVWGKVQTAFAEALGLEEDEVEPNHRIIEDLEAESLDFLDIAFRLERAFDIKIPRGGIESAAKDDLGEESYEVDGVLTPLALERLSQAMPEVAASEFRPGLKTAEVADLFRVATFYNLVIHLVAQKG